MNFDYLNHPFFQKLIQTVCRTLLHSLWQGLLLAILTGIILMATRKSRPALRYNLLSLSLLLFVFGSGVTFFIEFSRQSQTSPLVLDDFLVRNPAVTGSLITTERVSLLSPVDQTLTWLDQFFSQNASIIVAIWLVIFVLKSLKAGAGLFYIHQLKHNHWQEPEQVWKIKVMQLAETMGIRQSVSLFESVIVTVPLVVGILKPIIFIPAGILANLPANQIEAILLHELAHIKRRDYLVNLIQSFGENIFFFNPAVVWISALIREEREHCCDDIAISITKNDTSFVQALVSFQEYNLPETSHAMAFPGKRNALLDRIKRIIYKNNKSLNAMEKLFVTTSLIAAVLLTAAFSPNEKPEPVSAIENKPIAEKSMVEPAVWKENLLSETVARVKEPVVNLQEPTVRDTVPGRYDRIQTNGNVSNIETTKNNKRYEIESVDGKITSLKVDGQKIAEDQISSYHSDIDEIMQEVKVARENAEVERGHAEKARAEANVMRKQADEYRKDAEKMRAEAGKMREQANQARLVAEDVRKQAETIRGQAEKQREVAEGHRLKAEEHRKIAGEQRERAEVSRKEAEKSRVVFEKMQAELTNDLMKEGVLKDKTVYSYKLNSDELIVNGVKQPDALHQKMKAKYVKGPGWETVYNVNGRTGISITK
ncbi:M56 family metallopeptidase [Dyadobacter sp. LHD-138]|uniref:M56 family metallopeptidase n=1 Tax=Dyadobacter sp. LHD-138 TaxID=3071413 RepID=UPI0027E095CC|nr:M56 family metallopeptidase [Dyadobacter sp. LHD-138]MDQ6479899.1 M56 family metallopeptidase [Dyadobacter sp. LHD-138]